MATATKQSRADRQGARRADAISESAAIRFLVFEDNCGEYCWTIHGSDGRSLAYSGPYASRDEAAHAARFIRDGAGSARFEPSAASDHPVDLAARRSAAVARDQSDAERWLDEGSRSLSEAVAQWSAQH